MGLFNIKIGKKTVDKVINGAIDGADKLFFTKEEKAEYLKQIGSSALDFVKATANENTARSITRRIIAVVFVSLFALLLISAAIVYKIDLEYSKFLLDLAKEQNTIVMTIVIFYFGYYAVGSVTSLINRKK